VPLETNRQVSHQLLRRDRAPSWRAGLPVLLWANIAEFRNPNYHRPTDTPESLDYEFLAEVARLLVHAAIG
jgi:hypothetical protein